MQAKKLIEVAMPIKEISAESVLDVRIQHGHISSLHTWWARRPLPVSRAVVFASLIPDPLDENCPQAFREAVELLLGRTKVPGDPYKTYLDIPWTSILDPMEDNLRNRLQMFIGKFTEEMQQHLLKHKQKPDAKNQISNYSLIKWDNKNNPIIIETAQKIIWVAFNAVAESNAIDLLSDYDAHRNAIKKHEEELYTIQDRHLKSELVITKENNLKNSIEEFLNKMPKVFDPFTGGGAIPLEASRLGCMSFGNDINPVAHIIQKGTLEYPQIFGKPIKYSKEEFIKLYGVETWNSLSNENLIFSDGEPVGVSIDNRLSFDVNFYTKKILAKTDLEIGNYYPKDKEGNKPIAYYWAYDAQCSNPTCKADIPLLKDFYLVKNSNKSIFLHPVISNTNIFFELKEGVCNTNPFYSKRKLICPCCGSVTDTNELKSQFNLINKQKIPKMLAVVRSGKKGKIYSLPSEEDLAILSQIPKSDKPIEEITKGDSRSLFLTLWGIKKWGDMFSPRQLLTMNTLVNNLKRIEKDLVIVDKEYSKAVLTYLAIFVNRASTRLTSFGVWNPQYEKIQPIFSRQAIPMVFDFPEAVLDNEDGPIGSQLSWILKVIESESSSPFQTKIINASSGEKSQFPSKYLNAVVTDPPYYDAIGYADLSDFFYVWFKKTIGHLYPLTFATPQTPKTEECTALRHHHSGNANKAKEHFENKLLQIFDAIEYQTTDIVSIMFAHQSTDAWTTLCNSILGAKMNITGSWATDTEMTGALKTDKAFLSSSVTVSARPSQRIGVGSFRDVKKSIESRVSIEVEQLYKLGFRGADLLTACFGQSVSEFGKFEKVEKADGSEVTVAELLEMARESAFNALLKGFDGDDFTKFYIGWLQLYGFSTNDHNTATRIVQVGLSIDINDLYRESILMLDQSEITLASYKDRVSSNKNLGEKSDSRQIDKVHKAMFLFEGSRSKLLEFISKNAPTLENNLWRVLNSLCEVLPPNSEDYTQALGLLTNKESLIKESQNINKNISEQGQLEF
jgi:putative DNA methylase